MTIRAPYHTALLAPAIALALALCTSRGAIAADPDEGPYRAPDDSTVQSRLYRDDRWRLQAGGFAVIQRAYHTQYSPSLNLDYRWSWLFEQERNGFSIGPIVEAGVNIIVPYAKGGLEARYGGFFVDAHGGIAAGLVPQFGTLALPLFYGACGGYMFHVGETRLELETGLNATMLDVPMTFPYATIAVAW